MKDQSKKYLSDILRSIELIEQFTNNILEFTDYQSDLKTRSAVERQLGIIGEAVNKFNKSEAEFALENSGKIIGFRNRIIHSYDDIDQTIVWAILKNHLQLLKDEVGIKLNLPEQ